MDTDELIKHIIELKNRKINESVSATVKKDEIVSVVVSYPVYSLAIYIDIISGRYIKNMNFMSIIYAAIFLVYLSAKHI